MYSSVHRDKRYFIDKCRLIKASKYKVVDVDYEFTDETKISVECCPVSDINYFKAFYMSNKVDYSTGGDLGIVFLADGRAFGFLSFSKQLSTIEEIFMQSDFVVNSETAKLSKPLIMLAKSATSSISASSASPISLWPISILTVCHERSLYASLMS